MVTKPARYIGLTGVAGFNDGAVSHNLGETADVKQGEVVSMQ